MPYLIITNGPTGSGKSGLVQKVINTYQLSPTYTECLIDNLIENHPRYKQAVDNIIKSYCTDIKMCPSLENILLHPTPALIKKFNDAYFKVRKEKHCRRGEAAVTCDALLDHMLGDAFREGIM